jgi:uncharacterized membrane protein YdjX (TVP38/TMEM64 family)
MRMLLKFASLLALGLFAAVVWLGTRSGFDAAGASVAAGQAGLDLRSYTAGLAVGIIVTSVFRFGLGAALRRAGAWLAGFAPGFKLVMLALVFGGILIFY